VSYTTRGGAEYTTSYVATPSGYETVEITKTRTSDGGYMTYVDTETSHGGSESYIETSETRETAHGGYETYVD